MLKLFRNRFNHNEVFAVLSDAQWIEFLLEEDSDGSATFAITFQKKGFPKVGNVEQDEPITQLEFYAIIRRAKTQFDLIAKLIGIDIPTADIEGASCLIF